MAKILDLDKTKAFRGNERMVEDFVKELTGSTILIYKGEVIGTVLSPKETQQILYNKLIKRMLSNPELLSNIADDLSNDE